MANPSVGIRSTTRAKWWLKSTTLFCCILLAGCRSLVGPARIGEFSEATSLVTQGVSDAYLAVEASYREAALLSVLAQPNTSLSPDKFQPWIPVSSRNLRIEVLNGIAAYAEKLATLASGAQHEQVDQSTKALAAVLTNVGDEEVRNAFPALTKLTPENVGAFVTAVNAIGNWLVSSKSEKAIKQEITTMDPVISRVALTLAEEIGTLKLEDDGSIAPGSSGLRADAWNHFDTQAMALALLYDATDAKELMLRRKIAEDFTNVYRDQLLTDAALMAAADALGKLAKTHGALQQAYNKEQVAVISQIRNLAGEAKRLRDFYQALNEPKEE